MVTHTPLWMDDPLPLPAAWCQRAEFRGRRLYSQGRRVGAAEKRRTRADKSSRDDSEDRLWAGRRNEKGRRCTGGGFVSPDGRRYSQAPPLKNLDEAVGSASADWKPQPHWREQGLLLSRRDTLHHPPPQCIHSHLDSECVSVKKKQTKKQADVEETEIKESWSLLL